MRSLTRAAVLLTILFTALSLAAPSGAGVKHAKHWPITTSAVGPLQLGDSFRDLRRAGLRHYPCGGTKGHPCYFRGKFENLLAFDVDGHNRVKEFMVNARSGHGYVFATKHGTSVGSTVKALKKREHPKYLGFSGFGPAYEVRKGKHQRITFYTSGTRGSSTVSVIVVSRHRLPSPGR